MTRSQRPREVRARLTRASHGLCFSWLSWPTRSSTVLWQKMPHRVSRSLSRPSTFWYSACLSLATSAFAALGVEDKVLVDDVHLRYPSNVGSTCRRRCRRTVMTQCSMRVLRAASRKVACEHASSSEFSHGGSSENERHSLRNKARRTAASFASFSVGCMWRVLHS